MGRPSPFISQLPRCGQEAISLLLACDPGARAIVSSGYAADPVMANYADYGFKGLVAKPYTLATLRETLAQVLSDGAVT